MEKLVPDTDQARPRTIAIVQIAKLVFAEPRHDQAACKSINVRIGRQGLAVSLAPRLWFVTIARIAVTIRFRLRLDYAVSSAYCAALSCVLFSHAGPTLPQHVADWHQQLRLVPTLMQSTTGTAPRSTNSRVLSVWERMLAKTCAAATLAVAEQIHGLSGQS